MSVPPDAAWMQGDVAPVLVACDTGNLALLEHLVASGSNVNHAHPPNAVHGRKPKGEAKVGHPSFNAGTTPLMCASKSGHMAVAEALIQQYSADVRAQDAERWNALHYACFSGHADIAQLLLAHGCPSNVVTMFEKQMPVGFARHRRFAETCAACGDEDLPPALRTEERDEVVTRCLRKLDSAIERKEPLLHRYRVSSESMAMLRSNLRAAAMEDVTIDGHDIVLDAPILMRWSGDHAKHIEELRSRVAAGLPVLRASSVSGIQHVMIMPRAEEDS
mmetsp:Transcript_20059/g.36247  ORF Transcript_20059/g.36247 Transcript_20059/m.36247 type:complete len:276 (-) Transcript_20059:59-886(-)